MRRFFTTWALALALACAPVLASAQMLLLGTGVKPAAAGGGVTLNPSDIDPNGHIALSGGNLIATADGSGTYGSVRSTTSHSTGKFCFQWTSTTSNWQIGLLNGTDALTTDAGSKASSYVWYSPGTGQAYHNGSPTGLPSMTSTGFASGETGRFCGDFDAGKGWFFYGATGLWNGDNSTNQNPATGAGGFTITTSVAYFVVFSGFNADTATYSFATPTLPSGFSAW